ncbi:lysine 5,6-aminomutase reactivase ATPase KamC [Thermoflavimicrobium dichotomicum]|uniref:MutS domain V n=1 Tax=Thermoflavimicrobium dichotomicum TaxID=46223 RepID=A0A1I3K7S0_9BACL|nr:hypothetical protein [Thermoflavimicrobium dichotomicum]SFI68434.1 MutS domain V [Thermoflavimicrobium dichotomicum]
MWMDEETRKDILFDELLSRFQPYTLVGKRKARNLPPFLPGQEKEWKQLLDEQEILQREFLMHPNQTSVIRSALEHLPDIDGIIDQMKSKEVPSLTEWFQLKQFLWHSYIWMRSLQEIGLNRFSFTQAEIGTCELLLRQLNPFEPLQPSFALYDEFDPELKEARQQRTAIEREIQKQNELRAQAIEEKCSIRRNRFREWVVQRGTEEEQALLQDDQVQLVRETVYDRIFVLKPSKEQEVLQQEQMNWNRMIEQLEQKVLEKLTAFFQPYLEWLKQTEEKIVSFDLLWARVRAAESWQGVKPELSDESLVIEGGIHPLIAIQLEEQQSSFIPIDLEIKPGVTIIIGPNMGGKTVTLKTIGMIVALAQYGFFVPANTCRLPLFSWIASLMGDQQDVKKGLSTFGAEMVRLSGYLQNHTIGLLLLDEIGRGTNPVEGSALSVAVTRYLVDQGYYAVHVTHFRDVVQVEGIRGYRMGGLKNLGDWHVHFGHGEEIARSLQEQMDYRLLPLEAGDTIPEQALILAERLGLPSLIVEEARRRMQREGDWHGAETETR